MVVIVVILDRSAKYAWKLLCGLFRVMSGVCEDFISKALPHCIKGIHRVFLQFRLLFFFFFFPSCSASLLYNVMLTP